MEVVNIKGKLNGSAYLELELTEEEKDMLLQYAIIDVLNKSVSAEKKAFEEEDVDFENFTIKENTLVDIHEKTEVVCYEYSCPFCGESLFVPKKDAEDVINDPTDAIFMTCSDCGFEITLGHTQGEEEDLDDEEE